MGMRPSATDCKFDRLQCEKVADLAIGQEEMNCPFRSGPVLREALQLAQRIRAFQKVAEGFPTVTMTGSCLACATRQLMPRAVCAGGKAVYPHRLMNAIPATVAGVARRVAVVPAPDGVVSPLVLRRRRLVGSLKCGGLAVRKRWGVAYGTQTIDAVDKIVGPGNAYVATAKRQVFGTVGIDAIAGPSEIWWSPIMVTIQHGLLPTALAGRT